MKFLLFGFTIFIASMAFGQDWTWSGYEIIGYKSVTRTQIESMVQVKVGTKYDFDLNVAAGICEKIRLAFNFYQTHCSAVKYLDFKAYFVVEVIEQGDQDRVKFRPQPSQDIPLADENVKELYAKLYQRVQAMFSQGIAFNETHDKGYLDFNDEELSRIAAALAQNVPKFHDNILEVLKNDKSDEKRAQAANLLNWAGHAAEDVVVSAKLLDDPSSVVRNNISRFAFAFVGEVKDSQDRKSLMDTYLVQMMRPSHGDRNKALYSLLGLVVAYPSDISYLKEKGKEKIEFIAKQSVVYNVQGVAAQLLELFK